MSLYLVVLVYTCFLNGHGIRRVDTKYFEERAEAKQYLQFSKEVMKELGCRVDLARVTEQKF